MPLHHHESVRDEYLDSVYAGVDLFTTLPSDRFPPDEIRGDDAFQAISDELLLDGTRSKTWPRFVKRGRRKISIS